MLVSVVAGCAPIDMARPGRFFVGNTTSSARSSVSGFSASGAASSSARPATGDDRRTPLAHADYVCGERRQTAERPVAIAAVVDERGRAGAKLQRWDDWAASSGSPPAAPPRGTVIAHRLSSAAGRTSGRQLRRICRVRSPALEPSDRAPIEAREHGPAKAFATRGDGPSAKPPPARNAANPASTAGESVTTASMAAIVFASMPKTAATDVPRFDAGWCLRGDLRRAVARAADLPPRIYPDRGEPSLFRQSPERYSPCCSGEDGGCRENRPLSGPLRFRRIGRPAPRPLPALHGCVKTPASPARADIGRLAALSQAGSGREASVTVWRYTGRRCCYPMSAKGSTSERMCRCRPARMWPCAAAIMTATLNLMRVCMRARLRTKCLSKLNSWLIRRRTRSRVAWVAPVPERAAVRGWRQDPPVVVRAIDEPVTEPAGRRDVPACRDRLQS